MKRLLLTLVILLALAGVGFAEDMSLSVTLSIPEVPGLNAPPLTGQTIQNQQITARDAKIEEAMAAVQLNQEFIVTQIATATQIIQLVYSR